MERIATVDKELTDVKVRNRGMDDSMAKAGLAAKTEINSLRVSLDKANAEKERLQRLAQREFERGVSIQSELSKQTRTAQSADGKVQEQKAQIQKLSDTYKQLSEMYEDLRGKYKTLGGEHESLKKKMSVDIDDLQARSNADTEAAQKLVADRLAEMDTVRKNLERELAEILKERSGMEKEMKEMEAKLSVVNNELTAERNNYREQVLDLRKQLDERLTSSKTVNREHDDEDVREMVNRHTTEVEQLKSEQEKEVVALKESQVIETKAAKAKFHKILKKMEKERDDAKEEASVLQIELSLKMTELVNKTAEAEGRVKEMQALRIQLEQAKDRQRRTNRQAEEAKDRLRTQQVEKSAATAALDMKKRELAFATAERDRLLADSENIGKQYRTKLASDQVSQKEKQKMQTEIGALTTERDQLKASVDSLTVKLHSAEESEQLLRKLKMKWNR